MILKKKKLIKETTKIREEGCMFSNLGISWVNHYKDTTYLWYGKRFDKDHVTRVKLDGSEHCDLKSILDKMIF